MAFSKKCYTLRYPNTINYRQPNKKIASLIRKRSNVTGVWYLMWLITQHLETGFTCFEKLNSWCTTTTVLYWLIHMKKVPWFGFSTKTRKRERGKFLPALKVLMSRPSCSCKEVPFQGDTSQGMLIRSTLQDWIWELPKQISLSLKAGTVFYHPYILHSINGTVIT